MDYRVKSYVDYYYYKLKNIVKNNWKVIAMYSFIVLSLLLIFVFSANPIMCEDPDSTDF
jgi:hypothetical protein